MTAPKITTVHRTAYGSFLVAWADGTHGAIGDNEPGGVRAVIAESGQTLDIPDDAAPGWWGVPTDIPTPEPLPDLTAWCVRDNGRPWWTTLEMCHWARDVQLLATLTVTTDPATGEPVATVKRVTP